MTINEIIQQLQILDAAKQHTSGKSLAVWRKTSNQEWVDFKNRLPKTIPKEVEELLDFTSGISVTGLGEVDFLGRYLFEYNDVFPFALPILDDGSGNFWIIDIDTATGLWGAVFYVCHDPSVVVIQSSDLASFLEQILKTFKPQEKDWLTYIKEEAIYKIHPTNDHFISIEEARTSSDSVLASFAKELPHNFKIVDIRDTPIGEGFPCSGEVRRNRANLIFAIANSEKRSFFRKLFS